MQTCVVELSVFIGNRSMRRAEILPSLFKTIALFCRRVAYDSFIQAEAPTARCRSAPATGQPLAA